MDQPMNGLAEHTCAVLEKKVFVPIAMEKYNSKVIVSALCRFCGKMEFEKAIDKSFLPTKGSYITV